MGCSLTLLLCSFVKFVLRLESLRREFADFLHFCILDQIISLG
jgi:hypothetical protein